MDDADFPGFWAALGLDRVAKLSIVVNPTTLDVSTLQFLSQGSYSRYSESDIWPFK